MDRHKREVGKLELPTTGTKTELQRRLREQVQLQVIAIESYELQAPATTSGVNINSLLSAMMEIMQEANQKLFADTQEAARAENQKFQAAILSRKIAGNT